MNNDRDLRKNAEGYPDPTAYEAIKNVDTETYFMNGSVPVSVAARVYGKDASWIRAGIISGWLPIGKATRKGKLITNIEDMNSKLGRINFYISPKRLCEETGYVWKGER